MGCPHDALRVDFLVELTVRRFHYSGPVRALSRALTPLSRSESLGSLKPAALARSAFAQLGERLPEDPTEVAKWLGPEFEQAMTLLGEGEFTPLGQIHWRAILVSAAVGRLRLERYLAEGRPVGPVEAPLFVVGLPRTGTSLAQRLIALEPGRRGLKTYELLRPIPPPTPSRWFELQRYAYGALSSLIYRIFVPELLEIHHTSPTSLEECWMLFMPSYSVLNADYLFSSRAFGDWLMSGPPIRDAYERYKVQLGILGLESSDQRFVLKSPEHLWFLDEILRSFPDAKVIWTHRDPAAAVASYSAQISLPVRQHRGIVDPVQLGAHVLHRFGEGVGRAEQALARFAPGQIAHVRYDELAADPVTALRGAYAELDLPMTPDHEREMHAFLRQPQPDKHKNHYRAETFGLTAEEIRERFADYMTRFDLWKDKNQSARRRVGPPKSPAIISTSTKGRANIAAPLATGLNDRP